MFNRLVLLGTLLFVAVSSVQCSRDEGKNSTDPDKGGALPEDQGASTGDNDSKGTPQQTNSPASNPSKEMGQVAGSGAASSASPADGSVPLFPRTPGLHQALSLMAGKEQRSFHLFVPQGADSQEKRPLVILLHGHGGSADQVLGLDGAKAPSKVWMELATRNTFFLAVPDGAVSPDGKKGWNDCREDVSSNPSTDDVAFIAGLKDQLARGLPIDRQRVYLTGMSNGGQMALRLAIERGNEFAAVAPIVALMPKASKCPEPKFPIPILMMNGTADPIAPFEGGQMAGERGEVLSAAASALVWVKVNGVSETPSVTTSPDVDANDKSTITEVSHESVGNRNSVVLVKMIGAGHIEPSLSEQYSFLLERIFGRQNHDIEMAERVWSFFRGKLRIP